MRPLVSVGQGTISVLLAFLSLFHVFASPDAVQAFEFGLLFPIYKILVVTGGERPVKQYGPLNLKWTHLQVDHRQSNNLS